MTSVSNPANPAGPATANPANPSSASDASYAAGDARGPSNDHPSGQDAGGGYRDAGVEHDAGTVSPPPDSGTADPEDAGAPAAPDAEAPDVSQGPHPTPGVCMPDPMGTGNSLHVGAYCTAGGGQCGQYGLACAIDLDPQGGNFCIKLFCGTNTDCGESACCTGRAGNPIKACVPLGCVAQDAGACPM